MFAATDFDGENQQFTFNQPLFGRVDPPVMGAPVIFGDADFDGCEPDLAAITIVHAAPLR
jgi:hypothetical protein